MFSSRASHARVRPDQYIQYMLFWCVMGALLLVIVKQIFKIITGSFFLFLHITQQRENCVFLNHWPFLCISTVQRVVVATAAEMCQSGPVSAVTYARDLLNLPILSREAKARHFCVCFWPQGTTIGEYFLLQDPDSIPCGSRVFFQSFCYVYLCSC